MVLFRPDGAVAAPVDTRQQIPDPSILPACTLKKESKWAAVYDIVCGERFSKARDAFQKRLIARI
jgi:hypothetical protein